MNATAWLFWCVVQVTVLTCVVAIVYLAVRRLHPRAGAAAAGGGLIMVLALTALIASPWPRWTLSTRQGVAAVNASADRPEIGSLPLHSENGDPENIHGSSAVDRATNAQVETQQFSLWSHLWDSIGTLPGEGVVNSQFVNWRMWIGIAFLAGMILAAARLVWGIVLVRRLIRSARAVEDAQFGEIVNELRTNLELSSTVAVRESDELVTPAMVGWWRPIVLLPTSWREWSRDELRAALAHELSHIAGRDYATWLVARVAVVAHFYHPIVRWLASRLQLEQELAADMMAARLLGDSTLYLRSLASLALATPAHRVAGPVRTLIPSRSLLVRRVEMLRTTQMNRPRRSAARYVTFGIVALVGLLAAGLRGPGIDFVDTASAAAPTAADEAGAQVATSIERIGLELVPPDATAVVSFRAAEIAKHKELEKFVQLVNLTAPFTNSNLGVSDVAELMLIKYGDFAQSTKMRIVIRFVEAATAEALNDAGVKKGEMEKATESNVWTNDRERVAQVDARTVVVDHLRSIPPNEVAPIKNALPRWAGEWQKSADKPVLLAVDVKEFITGESHAWLFSALGNNPLSASLHPLGHEVDWALLSASLDEKLQVSLVAKTGDEKSAAKVGDTLQAVFVLLRNMAEMHTSVEPTNHADSIVTAHLTMARIIGKEVDALLKSAKFEVDGNRIKATLQSESSLAKIADLANLTLPLVEEERQAARRSTSINNLRQLQLAMINHESATRQFPMAASYTYRKNGEILRSKHPHSWRVAILPFLGRRDLYDQYRFDEPWDSEANKKVLERMPEIFRAPEDPDPRSLNTSYFVLTGDDTVFPPDKSIGMAQVSDGTSRTVSLVESKRPVPWTKPEDIPYSADQPLPELGGWVPEEFLAALVDGSVQRVALGGDEAVLRAWITRAGEEVIDGILPQQ
jgi:beta-lactamase regulating signal transducer with metallopeptidase domain